MSETAPRGRGKIKFILLLIVMAGIGHVIYHGFTGGVPQIQLTGELRGIGQSTVTTITASDRRGLRSFEVTLEQDGQIIPLLSESYGSR